ncbi:hypothetical protein Ancab_037547 [Ancistrocladus abbreviatus]
MAERHDKIVADIGRKLAQQSRLSKDFIIKSLQKAAKSLSELEQLSSLKPAISPLSESLVKHGLLQHKDEDVRLLVAVCFSEIIWVLAPDPCLSDEVFREVFKLFVSMFKELGDTKSPYFPRRVKILEKIAAVGCCLRMLDIGSEDLILQMFHTFFDVVSDEHERSLVNGMLSIMTLILKEAEEISQPLLDEILQNLRKKREGQSPASYRMAVDLIQNCEGEIKPAICRFVTSCILDRDNVKSKLKGSYHEIIFEIFCCASQIRLAVIPSITQELLTDQVDVRIKSVNLIGKLLALPEDHGTQEHHHLLAELLKRFSDKVAEVRISAIHSAKNCYLANPSVTESHEILSAVEGRLLDIDSSVRMEAVIAVCDMAKSSLKNFPAELIVRATERLRDKMTSVRKEALKKLLEVYRHYCSKCREGQMTLNEKLEQIPCRLLTLCYDKNLKEFRPQNLEHVLAKDLFLNVLPVEERIRHWIFLYSLFTAAHVKAFNSILCQKRRLQTEMRVYLSLQKTLKENGSEDVRKRIKIASRKISLAFVNPVKAEECFDKLNLVNDNSILDGLMQLLDEAAFGKAMVIRDKFLKKIGDKHPCFEFLESLTAKCIYNMFDCEHVHSIVEHIFGNRCGDSCLLASSVDLLLAIITNFPSLLRGSENKFTMVTLEDDPPHGEKLIQILAKAAPFLSVTLSDIYPSLERWCLEGKRVQSKVAVSAISAFISPSEQFFFADLCQKLVDSLHKGRNLPAVLQSLCCIARLSISAFQKHEEDISLYIKKKIFLEKLVLQKQLPGACTSDDERSGSSVSFDCEMKILGLKTLVKCCLENKGAHEREKMNQLLDILAKLLQKGEFIDGSMTCESGMDQIRLAAAKSVLKLSGKWDLHMSPQIFLSTVMMAKDASSFVRRLFLDKIHKLLKMHAIPIRYACAFSLATSDCLEDLQEASSKYLAEFIKDYSRVAWVRQTCATGGGSMIDHPAYMVVFLLHVLAHDPDFPHENCNDGEIYAHFCRPLSSALHALVNGQFFDGQIDLAKETFLYLRRFFQAIKRAEDAVDLQKTPKLHILADIGISVLNAMECDGVNLALAPGPVLLPSSLYRTSLPQTLEEANRCPIQVVSDENFVKKLTYVFKSNVSQPITSVKRRKQFQKDASQLNIRDQNVVDLELYKQIDSSSHEMEAQRDGKDANPTAPVEVSTTGSLKAIVSSFSPGPEKLLEDSSVVEDPLADGLGNQKPILRNNQELTFDSVTSKLPGLESEISSQELDVLISADRKDKRKRKGGSYSPESVPLSKTKCRSSGSSKGSAVTSLNQLDARKHPSLDNLTENVVDLTDATAGGPVASQCKGKILHDRTNSLTVNGLKERCQQKKNHIGGLKGSVSIPASQELDVNKEAIAFRTRRKKA